jgi:pyruvate dehydrogenase E1 component alpha subunit
MKLTDKISDLLSREQAKSILHNMLLIRRFEEVSAQQYSAGNIRGFLHLYNGEDAIAASILPELQKEDQFFGTYREHGHALVKGISAKSIMSEMFGKVEGCSKGRGGSMHLFDISKSFYGGNAIVGGHLPLAVGMALANKMQDNNLIAVCFFGEGAIAEGAFHESMNLAKLWQLPVLFVCENNYYAMGTAIDRSESQICLVKKAQSYNIESKRVNGMSVPHLVEESRKAVEYVREKKDPFFLECETYRFKAHSMFDSQKYRSKEEVEKYKKCDPIPTYIKQLTYLDWIDQNYLTKIKEEIEQTLNMAIEFAEQGNFEDLNSCLNDVMEGVDHS